MNDEKNVRSGEITPISTIIARDSRRVPFQPRRIVDAMREAFKAAGETPQTQRLNELVAHVGEQLAASALQEPHIDQIQDAIEQALLENGHLRAAKAYVIDRSEKTRAREHARLMRTFDDISHKAAGESDLKRENANIDGDSAMGTMLRYGSEGVKRYFEMFVLNPKHAAAHRDGEIHIHDLDFLTMTTTCCQMDLIKLFRGGFATGHGSVREPNDIRSYASLACIAIQSNQNDQHGGQSIVNFDYGLAPGVKKTFRKLYLANLLKTLETASVLGGEAFSPKRREQIETIHRTLLEEGIPLRLQENEEFCRRELQELIGIGYDPETVRRSQEISIQNSTGETDRETAQAMDALIHDLNTMLSRSGAQTPFSSINYGTDTSPEGRMVVRNVLLAHQRGLGNGETPIFPIHVFRVKKGLNAYPGDPNYDLFQLACRVSAKRLFPNFAFLDAPFNLKYYVPGRYETEVAYMGCRTRVIGNAHDPNREIAPGRGNLSFTSINFPRIALNAQGNVDRFFEELDRRIELCIEQLLERFKIQSGKKARNYPFLFGQGVWIDGEKLGPEDRIGEVLKHGTLSLGFIGLAETLKILTGFHHGQKEDSQKLGLEIVSRMRKRLDEKSEQTGLNFTLLATPAEGLAGRFVKIDRTRFGTLEGITDRDYYTNSFHVPVYHPISIMEKIRIEAPYHALTNAGHITYVEVDGDMVRNPEAFEKIIHAMCEAGIGYGSINHPVDRDTICGYTGQIKDTCPQCGRGEGDVPFDRIRRITGYLVGTLDRFNNAKRREVEDRITHGTE